MSPRRREGRADRVGAGRQPGQVIVLDQDGVVQPDPVVLAAAAPDRVLLQRRQPGVVLRVSRIAALVPATSATNRAVRVAIPLSRWRKFKAVRSNASSERIGPAIRAISLPPDTRSPSSRPSLAGLQLEPSGQHRDDRQPRDDPSDRLANRADPLALAGIVS